jgi:NADH-quinone oxidoreductase subunit I
LTTQSPASAASPAKKFNFIRTAQSVPLREMTTIKTMPRPKLTFWERTYLPQIIGGLKITLRRLLAPTITLEYPEQRPALPRGYRGAPTLVRDAAGREKCVSCQLCEFVCPPKAIRITPAEIPAGAPNAHVEKMPAKFEINMLRCIYCGLCQEVCPEEAIHLQTEYSLCGTSRKELVRDKQALYAAGGTLPTHNHKWG